MWNRLFVGPENWQAVCLALLPTLAIAWLAAHLARRLATASRRGIVRDTVVPSSPLVRGPLRLVGAAALVLTIGILLFPAFELFGLQPRTGVQLRTLAAWTFLSGLRVVLIVLLAYALIRATGLLVKRFEHELTQGTGLDALERAKRARTLGAVLSKVVTVLSAASRC